jgi:anti-anti-sigma factor
VTPAWKDRLAAAQLRIHRTIDCDHAVGFLVAGEIDMAVAERFRAALMAAVHRRRVTRIVIDLEPLRFMDSTGAAVLIDVRQEAQRRGTVVHVVNAHGAARTVLEALNIYRDLTREAEPDAGRGRGAGPPGQEARPRSQASGYRHPLCRAAARCVAGVRRRQPGCRVRPRRPWSAA